MSFIFRDFESWLWNSIETLTASSSPSGKSEAREHIERMAAMKEKLVNGVIEYVITAKPKAIKQYTRLLQIMLVNLLDKLRLFQPSHPNPSFNLMQQSAFEHIKDLLLFLKQNCADYFDFGQKVPDIVFKETAKEILTLAEAINEASESASVPLRYILQAVINAFRAFCNNSAAATFADCNYYLEAGRTLLTEGSLSSEAKTRETLFYFNFNHKEVCHSFMHELEQKESKEKTKIEKLFVLLHEQKKINQYLVKEKFCLNTELPSLKDQLNRWISEEIKFLENDEALHQEDKNNFVHISFRGAEIYLLYKAFVDSGGTAGETYKSLIGKTAPHLVNNNQKGFSVESLQKNSDKVNYEIKDNVKRFLQKMIRNIDSY